MPNFNRQLLILGRKSSMDTVYSQHVTRNERGIETFDFNTIAPMPSILEETERGTRTDDGIELALARINPDCTFYGSMNEKINLDDYEPLAEAVKAETYIMQDLTKEELAQFEEKYGKDGIAEIEAMGKQAIENFKKYGHTDWYTWAIANWGTKWNATNTERVSDTELAIETAWDPAIQVWLKLSKQYPTIPMVIMFSDEQLGENCGYLLFKNGVVDYSGMFPNQSIDAWKLSLKVWGLEDEYHYDEKKKKYVENGSKEEEEK